MIYHYETYNILVKYDEKMDNNNLGFNAYYNNWSDRNLFSNDS